MTYTTKTRELIANKLARGCFMHKLTVGQKLWWMPSNIREFGCEVTVTKVGRKWAHLDNFERIDTKTLVSDGVAWPNGRCYLSQAEHQAELALSLAWQKLCFDLKHRSQPTGVTLESIAAARVLLGLDAAANEKPVHPEKG